MARRPFYGQGGAIPIAKMNMQAATAPGRAYAQMGKDFGDKIGSAIKQYGLNKAKRAKLTGEIEAYYEQNPNAISEIGMSGDEAQDKKDFAEREKFMKGDMSMAQLEGYAGKLARGDVLKTKAAEAESRRIANEMGGLNLSIAKELKDTQINIGLDREVLSSLARQLAQETNPQKIDLIKAQFTDAIANLGLGGKRRELEEKQLESKLSLVDPQTNATRSALTASEIKSDTDSAYILGQGGPAAAAAQRVRDDDLKRSELKAGIRSKDTLSDYRIKSIELLEGKSNLPQGAGNEDIETSIKGIDSEIERIMKGQTFSKDSDGNTLSYSDLIEDINPITGEVTLSEDTSGYASKDLARLKELVQSKMKLRLSQKYEVLNRNGELIEVTLAEIEEQKAKERMQQTKIKNAVRSAPPTFPIPDYH